MTPSSAPSVSPLLKRRKAEARCPAARMSIPTILVENEPMETESGPDVKNKGEQQKLGKVLQSKMDSGTPEKGKIPITSVEQFKMRCFYLS